MIKFFLHYLKRSLTELNGTMFFRTLKWFTRTTGKTVFLDDIGHFYRSSYDDTLMTFYIDRNRESYLAHTLKTRWTEGSFIDIGANIGIFSILASKNENLNVMSFEPSKINYGLLEGNVSINSTGNIKLFNAAIGGDSNVGFLKFDGSKSHIVKDAHGAERVDFFDLQDHKDVLKRPVYCKIDVEGFELNVVEAVLSLDIQEYIIEILDSENMDKIKRLLSNYVLIHTDGENFHFSKKTS